MLANAVCQSAYPPLKDCIREQARSHRFYAVSSGVNGPGLYDFATPHPQQIPKLQQHKLTLGGS